MLVFFPLPSVSLASQQRLAWKDGSATPEVVQILEALQEPPWMPVALLPVQVRKEAWDEMEDVQVSASFAETAVDRKLPPRTMRCEPRFGPVGSFRNDWP